MRAPIGRVHGTRRHARGQRPQTISSLRTTGLLVTSALGLLMAPLAANAQQAGKIYRIGLLSEGMPPISPLFLEELRLLGYREGHNLVIEYRYAETREQLPTLAAELLRHEVDLLVTFGTPSARSPSGQVSMPS